MPAVMGGYVERNMLITAMDSLVVVLTKSLNRFFDLAILYFSAGSKKSCINDIL